MDSQNLARKNEPLAGDDFRSALFEQAVENSPDLISVVDKSYVYRMVNAAYLKRYELTEDQIVGVPASEILGKDVFEKVVRPYLDRSLAGETISYQDWFAYPDLGRRYMDVCYYPMPDDDGSIKCVAVVIKDVTEGKKAEEALRLSEERYRRILDSSRDIIIVMDENAKIVFANKAWYDSLTYTEEDLENIGIFGLIHPDDRERVKSLYQGFIDGVSVPSIQYRRVKKDGEVRWMESNGALIHWPGTKKAIVSVLRDVTERKKMEEAVRESEEKYRTLIEQANDIISETDPKTGKIISFNRFAEEMLGYTEEDIRSMASYLDIIHPDDREAITSALARYVGEGKRSPDYRVRARKADGSYIQLEQNAALIRDAEGNPQSIIAIARDVTERNRMEKALRLSEERYNRILNASHDMIIVLDADAQILYANEAWREYASYTVEEMNDTGIFEKIYSDDRRKTEDQFRQALAGEPAPDVEFRFLTKEGKTKWVEAKAGAIDWPGAARAAMISARDVTTRKRAEDALERSLSLISATLESTADGILTLDNERRITGFNRKFKQLWNIPDSTLIPEEDEQPLKLVLDQLEDPEGFLEKVKIIHDPPKREHFDIIKLKDGRVFERYVNPQKKGNEIIGLVLSFRDITDRLKAEQALKESEERYRNIFREAPDIFYTLDLDTWMVTEANQHALKTLEYAREMLGKIHVSEIIHPDDLERATGRLVDMVINKDRMPGFSLRILTRTGKVRHIEQSGVIFWDNEGNAKTFLGLAHDVTHRMEQDEMIRKRNERLAALYEVAKVTNESLDLPTVVDLMMKVILEVTNSDSIGIYSFDEKTNTLDYIAQQGLTDEFVKATSRIELGIGIHGIAAAEREPAIINDFRTHPGLSRPIPTTEKDPNSTILIPLIAKEKLLGTLTIGRNLGNPYSPDDFELAVGLANQVALSMENANLYSEIAQRETRLQTILETSRDGIAVISPDHRLAYGNSSLTAMFGYDDFDDLSELDTSQLFSAEGLSTLDDIRDALADGREMGGNIQFKGKRKDGSAFDGETGVGSFIVDGRRFAVGVVRDVTERNRLRSQLEQSGKLAAIGELAAGIAHEINNPIATLDVRTGLMRDILIDERGKVEAPLMKRFQEYLDVVDRQVQRCQSVTNNLLSFSRTPRSAVEPIEINGLLRKAVNLITSLSGEKPKIELLLDESLPRLHGDPNRLEQVFVNMLSNAFKAIKSGGSITLVTGTDTDGNIRIEFRDTGTGIPSETRARIFEPFFTTDEAGGGTGLGLSISYYIITDMNGSIDVESSPGQGSTFTITLATAPEDESSHAS